MNTAKTKRVIILSEVTVIKNIGNGVGKAGVVGNIPKGIPMKVRKINTNKVLVKAPNGATIWIPKNALDL